MRHILGGVTALFLALAGAIFLTSASPASAHTDKDCGDFANQAAAQAYYLSLGGPASDPDRLDADHDGIACDTLPCPCSSSTGGGGGGNTSAAPRAAVKVTIAKRPAGSHDWRFVCTVKRAGKAYAGKRVTFQWRDRNHRRWHGFVDTQTGKPVKITTGPRGKARMRVVWEPPKGQARCTTAADSRSKAGASKAMPVAPR